MSMFADTLSNEKDGGFVPLTTIDEAGTLNRFLPLMLPLGRKAKRTSNLTNTTCHPRIQFNRGCFFVTDMMPLALRCLAYEHARHTSGAHIGKYVSTPGRLAELLWQQLCCMPDAASLLSSGTTRWTSKRASISTPDGAKTICPTFAQVLFSTQVARKNV